MSYTTCFYEINNNAIFCNLYCIDKNNFDKNNLSINQQRFKKQIKLSGFIGIQYLIDFQYITLYNSHFYQQAYDFKDNDKSSDRDDKKNNNFKNSKEKINKVDNTKQKIRKEYFFLLMEEYNKNKRLYMERIAILKPDEIYKTINDFMDNKIKLVNLENFHIIDKRLVPYYVEYS